MRYGVGPHDETVYGEALAYQKMLSNQIATLAIECTTKDATVTLDGQPIKTCPTERRVLPGRHQIVGKRDGFATRTIELTLFGGKSERVRLELLRASEGRNSRVVHRWPAWVPWTVFASGFAIAGVGGLVQRAAIGKRDDYYAALRECGGSGCPPDYSGLAFRDTALTYNRIAVGLFVAGGATIATGVVMLVLNRGRTVEEPQRATAVITPTAAGATVTLVGRF